MKKRVWVFGSLAGDAYNDNSKYLFEFVSVQAGEQAVWLTRQRALIRRLRRAGRRAYHFYSLPGIFYALRATYVVISYAYNDVGPFCYLFPRSKCIINLFHGTPLKNLNIEVHRGSINIFFRRLLRAYLGRKYDYIISASDVASEQFERYFAAGRDTYLVTGYPRNDALFRPPGQLGHRLKQNYRGRKIILYAPTYREHSEPGFDLFAAFGFDQARVEQFLARQTAILLIKSHWRSRQTLRQRPAGVVFIDDIADNDIYPILAQTDLLITDYSSIYFDFLLLNRPIIFAPFDLSAYTQRDRGFFFNYDEVTPGPKAKNWEDVIRYAEAMMQGRDAFTDQRRRLGRFFNAYSDGHNSARVYRRIRALSGR